jgi:hypothetical protein
MGGIDRFESTFSAAGNALSAMSSPSHRAEVITGSIDIADSDRSSLYGAAECSWKALESLANPYKIIPNLYAAGIEDFDRTSWTYKVNIAVNTNLNSAASSLVTVKESCRAIKQNKQRDMRLNN